jgi:hypothetical protein
MPAAPDDDAGGFDGFATADQDAWIVGRDQGITPPIQSFGGRAVLAENRVPLFRPAL